MTDALLTFLRGTAPITTSALWNELTLAGQRKPPEDLPQTLGELASALLGMAVAGLIEERHGEWVVVVKVKQPEGRLFA